MTGHTLLIRRGGLGDTLLAVPLLRALEAEVPGQVHFVGVRDFTAVVWRHGLGRCERSAEDLELWALGRPGAVGDRARRRLSGYRRVIGDTDDLLPLAALGVAVQVYDPRPRSVRRPLAEQLVEQVLGPGAADRCRHGLPGAVRLAAADASGPVVLAPGSGAAAKCWPRARWLELAGLLAQRGIALQVVRGPAERERPGGDPARWRWPAPVTLLEDLAVVDLAARLAAAALFVGNDSGTTHLAAALAVPTVAVFGPTEPRVWAPQGEHVRVVGARCPGPPVATVAEVGAAITAVSPRLR